MPNVTRYVGTVTRLPNGKIGLPHQFHSDGIGRANFGGWQERDIGKRVYRNGSVYQMENDEQLAARLARTRHGVG